MRFLRSDPGFCATEIPFDFKPPAIAAHNTVVAFCRDGVSAEVSRGLSYVLSARPVYCPYVCLQLIYLLLLNQIQLKIGKFQGYKFIHRI